MTGAPDIAGIADYLAATGWLRTPEAWNGAQVWARDGDEVLLPARDDLRDTPARIRDVIRTLALVEERGVSEVVRSIAMPDADATSYRMREDEQPPGITDLTSGWNAIRGVQEVVRSAARVVLDGPHYYFGGRQPREVTIFLGGVRLVGAPEGEVGFSILVPAGGRGRLTGRAVLTQLLDATTAVRRAVDVAEATAFDHVVTAGASANFCEALSDLAGGDRRSAFTLRFTWAAALPSETGPTGLLFPPDTGLAIRAAGTRLRRLDVVEQASITGPIEELHDDPADRWRVRVRGVLRMGRLTEPRRAIWVRLPDNQAYLRAIEAHRTTRTVHASGVLTRTSGRVELSTAEGRFDDETLPRTKDDRAR